MTNTIEETNKALVLEAFDTPFNKRDYEAAARYWLPNYLQHSAHIPRRPRPLQPGQGPSTHTEVRGLVTGGRVQQAGGPLAGRDLVEFGHH